MPPQLPADTRWHTLGSAGIFANSRAISWTSCEKGLFQIRSSMLFWNWQILQRATVSSQYLWGFFSSAACQNSFWGVLPPMVGWSFLQAGSSPPNVDDLTSTAIWANLVKLVTTLVTSPTILVTLPPLSFCLVPPKLEGFLALSLGGLPLLKELAPHVLGFWSLLS